MKTMTAKYPGSCKLCGGSIAPGDSIKWIARGNTQHADCNDGHQSEAERRNAMIIDHGYEAYAREEGHYDTGDH